MASVEDNIKAAKTFVDAMNKHDEKLLGSVCNEDAVATEMAFPDEHFTGRAEIEECYRELFDAFPDCETKVLSTIADENGVQFEVSWKGTNKADFRGIPATNTFVDVPISYVFHMKDGKIQEIQEFYDELSVEIQMGLRESE